MRNDLTPQERFAAQVMAREDFYFFVRWMFMQRRGYRWQRAAHHKAICDALTKVFRGESKRLILNIPPRYSKTETAVVNWPAWCLGHFPDAEFIHTSYSGQLAVNNSSQCRDLIQQPAYRELFPAVQLKGDSNAKHEWRTTEGGCFYAVGAGGTITGYGAGKMRPKFGGCFPVGTRVWTDRGLLPIDRIVRERMSVRVWSYDYSGHMVLRAVTAWHENPPNAIVRITLTDGEKVECTPDHKFWTENRGWVRADSLCVDDHLPRVYGGIESLDYVRVNAEGMRSRLDAAPVLPASAVGAVEKCNVGLLFGEGGSEVRFSAALVCHGAASGDGLPRFSPPDLVDDSGRDAELHRQINGTDANGVVDGKGLLVGENGSGVDFGFAECPVLLAVNDVRGAGIVSQIGAAIVGAVAVEVASVGACRALSDKGQHHKLVDVEDSRLAVPRQVDPEVPMPVIAGLENALRLDERRPLSWDDATLTSDAAKVADRIQPFISGHRKPVLVEHVRHDDVTFCLTVDEYHNFTIESGLVVKNCIIIDDPHKADEARSDVMRQNVIDWFQNTLESRLNSPDTPIILIMQRLHERDLAGWLLDGGNGEHWDHVCLKALQDDGTALWPEKHTVEDLHRMRVASPYTFAGQYQQAPAPPEGNIFKPDNLEVVDAVPSGTRFVRAWDFGATDGAGDPTVGLKLGLTPSGRYVIADVVRFQGGPDAVEAALKNTAARDGKDCAISIPQDPGQAGKSQVAYFTKQLAGYPIHASPESGDKITRAEPFASQVNVGNVMMLRSPWNDALVSEMRVFPNGANDDQVDAGSRAFARLVEGDGMGVLNFYANLSAEAAKASKDQQ